MARYQFLKVFFFILTLLVNSVRVNAASISGKVELHESWQPVIFLSSVNTPQDLNVASPDFIIAQTFINPDGTFAFENIALPNEPRFYRLHLVKSENALVEYNVNVENNLFHILADNSSDIILHARTSKTSFYLTEINEHRNVLLNEFEKTLQLKKSEIKKDISKAQKDFIQLDIENYIRNFVDSCSITMLSLYAIYQIEEKETDFLKNNQFYFDFQKRINSEFPNTPYNDAYNNLLSDLIGFRDLVCEIPGVAPKWKDNLLIIESILLVILLLIIIVLWRSMKKLQFEKTSDALLNDLTQKEKEILNLMASGMSNKEIAASLFVELSTVKTHINNIYKQLKVSGRKEATSLFNANKK